MSLITRVRNVALRPKEEWPVIAEETTSTAALYAGVIVPLALIGPMCKFLGDLVFGQTIPIVHVTFHPSVRMLIGTLVTSYVLALAGVWVTALVVQKVAPSFQSSTDFVQSLKLVTFSQAPFWVAGVLNVIPFLSFLPFLVALYGLYLVYVGMPVVLKTPPDKVVPYLLVVIGITIVVWVVIGILVGAIVGAGSVLHNISS